MPTNNLQKLLDEKWPLGSDKTIQGRLMNEHNRKIFTEGYNAAKEEANKPQEESAVVKMLRAVTERLEWMTIYAEMGNDAEETDKLLKSAKALIEQTNK